MLCCFAHREQQGLFKEQTKGNINNKVCRLNKFAMMMMMMMIQDGNYPSFMMTIAVGARKGRDSFPCFQEMPSTDHFKSDYEQPLKKQFSE